MFRRLLIANRGEIAVRIIRTCRALGIETVAVYSDVDTTALHVTAADFAESIGPPSPAESYLSESKIIDAARRAGAEAVHPGYGFLSESPAFAEACGDAGLCFVGPSPAVIARTGSKIDVRRLAKTVGVPVVPGGEPTDQSSAGLRAAVEDVGFPALLKPSAGGGGKGMRVVRETADVDAAIVSARREASAAFGDDTIYVERHLQHPRHVEVQVAADGRDNVIHLFDRECSIQRRYQKVIEESPAPALSDAIRRELSTAATTIARAAGYDNIGTVEFLVDGATDDDRFYFLEMNTRLQVEHPVTELVTGVDLVRGQLEIAAGAALPWTQSSLRQQGHAIECRVYAEDPDHDFLPQAGRIALYREPTGPGLRVDTGVCEGSDVPVHYDPLLAKVIAHGESRGLALARLTEAIRRYAVLGIGTNLNLLGSVLSHPRFAAGSVDTHFLEDERDDLYGPVSDDPLAAVLAVAATHYAHAGTDRRTPTTSPITIADPWNDHTGWRLDNP